MAPFLILIFISIRFASAADVNPPRSLLSRDRAALLSFASSISLDPDGALTNWGSSDVCNWTGIVCNPVKQRVVQLDLNGRGLRGVISPAVSNLSFLSVLDLSENYFHGKVPTELGALSRMTQLSLKSNLLDGFIPSELGLLRQLVYLDLGSNLLDGAIPNSLFCNTSLQYIDLSNNSLQGKIPEQCGLLDLRYLLLWTNELVGSIPSSLANSSKLEWIDLESNFLSGGLPSKIFAKTPNLQYIYLSYNNLSINADTDLDSFFASLANCSRLQELELAGNGMKGVIPQSIGHLSTKLVELHLEQNFLTGHIPLNITNLVNLTYLNLSNNLLNGSIPPDISRLKMLERAYLSNNHFSGEIPLSLGEMPRLGLLDLSGNMLSGPIPETLSNLSQLRTLMLPHNQLTGTIPQSLGNCNLEMLDLSHNQLTGRIPSGVAGLRSLRLYLNLSSNFLQGSLPLDLSKLDMVIALDFSANNLSGNIPPQLGSCIALEYLNLSGNALQGSLPGSIGALPYLEVLDLSFNQLAGALPESLQASSALKTLNISYNNFSGVIADGAFSSLPPDSFLGNPYLCGSIPSIPDCSSKKMHRSVLMPLLLSLIGSSCVIGVVGYPIVMKTRRKSPSTTFRGSMEDDTEEQMRTDYPKISYLQLLEATGGFSESSLIGSGTFGQVYKGILPDEARIAVKVLYSSNEEIGGSFRRECQVLKRTRHRNLIRIITTCSRSDFKALVLPLMSNGSLEGHLYPAKASEGHGLSLVQIVSIASDVAEGMAYLHHHAPVSVVHCDLKPSNVLLDEDMTALVSDFGIAKLVKGGMDESNGMMDSSLFCSTTGLLGGSVGYIAPEYGLGGRPTIQGDVYSFGVLLLEILTGKRPTDVIFNEGLTIHEWVRSQYHHDIERIIKHGDTFYQEEMSRDVAIELIELGLVCSQYTPSTRPTMIDVASELALIKKDMSRQQQHAIVSTESTLYRSP